MQRLAVAGAVCPGPEEAHIDDLDRRPVLVDPIQTADDLRPGAAAVAAKHLDRPEAGTRRHADDAGVVVFRPDRAGDMGAMAVVVGPAPGAGAVLAASDGEFSVIGVDPRVEHGNVGF